MADLALSPLAQYQHERDQQLERALNLLIQDERVSAVWVFGSLGCGCADALSDIDLTVVVRDEYLQAVISERHIFAAQAGRLLFTVDAPQNAPPGGSYWMICHDAPLAPHLIDVYWQSDLLAWESGQARLLFERVEVAAQADPSGRLPGYYAISPGAIAGAALPHPVRFFWMMLLIAAKYAWRNPQTQTIDLLEHLVSAYQAACRLAGVETPSAHLYSASAAGTLDAKLSVLRELATRMSDLMAWLDPACGEEILRAVERYLAMIEMSAA